MPPESHITALRDDSPELHANVVQLCFLQILRTYVWNLQGMSHASGTERSPQPHPTVAHTQRFTVAALGNATILIYVYKILSVCIYLGMRNDLP